MLRARIGGAGVVVVLFGCSVDAPYEISRDEAIRYAELRCRAMTTCCEPPADDCVAQWTSTVLGWQGEADGSRVFSRDCMTEALAWMESLPCDDEVHLDGPYCRLAHGDRVQGEPCVEFGDLVIYGHDCADGLQCLAGRCVDDPLFVADAPPGGFCDSVEWTCGDEYFCSAQGICEPNVGPGESCGEAGACRSVDGQLYYCAGLASEGVGTCQPRPLLGEACTAADDPCGFGCDESSACSRLECVDGICSFMALGPVVCEG